MKNNLILEKISGDNVIQIHKNIFLEVYEIKTSADLADTFLSLADKDHLNSLCMSKVQIQSFCSVHKAWLADQYLTNFFLSKHNEQFVVRHVSLWGKKLSPIRELEFDYKFACSAMFPHRFIVPVIKSPSRSI
jgi:hypothetical protein